MTASSIVCRLDNSYAKTLIRLSPTLGATQPVPVESSPQGVLDESLEQVECNANAGMPQVVQIIGAPNVDDINLVVVVPAQWPSYIEPEPIAAVLEALIPAYHRGTDHVERVVMTEMGTVMVVRNAAIMVAVVATVVSNGLWLLVVLRLLYALWLLLVLRLLCLLRLLLVLCVLRLLLVLRLLCALRLLLCLLCVLRLLLVLRLLCFSSASALFLLSFLCECRNGGSEK